MADEQNLELPKLFRRRRKEAASEETAPETVSAQDGASPDPADSAAGPAAPAAEVASPPAEAAPEPTPPEVAPEPTPREVAPEPTRSEPTSPIPASDETSASDGPPVHAASTSTVPVAPAEPTRVLADGPPPPVAVREREEPADEPEPSERGPRLTLPQMPGALAAALTGLVVGAVAVALVLGAGLGCRAVGGTSSCGGGPGTLILLGILALAVVLGTILLRACGVAEGLSVSALAVGLVGVAVMLFLLEVVFSAWMTVVIPLLTIAAFALAWWVTVRLAAEAAHDLD